MDVRRIVTGLDADGSSTIVSDGPAPVTHDFVHVPGFSNTVIWGTDIAEPSAADPTTAMSSFVPGPGGTRFVVARFPPDSVFASPGFDPEAAGREQLAARPGLGDPFAR